MISEIKNNQDYKLDDNASFLQSWKWGEVLKNSGHNILRLKLDNIFISGVIKEKKNFYKEISFARINLDNISQKSFDDLNKYLKQNKFSFASFDVINKFKLNSRFIKIKEQNRQPNQTLLLNLENSEEDLLKTMHSKTRYNIRLAKKRDIEIKQEKDLDIFWDLNKETKLRDNFSSNNKEHYKNLLDSDLTKQFVAYKNNVPVATNICVKYKDEFVYLHGASSHKYKSDMAPYLLQWQQILEAKKLGCKKYDFWGVAVCSKNNIKNKKNNKVNCGAREDALGYKDCFNNFCWNKKHSWSGFTRFKVGFGGEYKEVSEGTMIVYSLKDLLLLKLLPLYRFFKK